MQCYAPIEIFVVRHVAPRHRIIDNEQWVYVGTTRRARSLKRARASYAVQYGVPLTAVKAYYQED